jgi:putative ABC transport system ATP-binding protein
MGTEVLRVERACKVYGSGHTATTAVADATFEAAAGEFLALVGPSGSGKTTLLAMLGGLLTPSGGRILAGGTDLGTLNGKQLARYRRERVGFVFQGYNLLPYLTARGNLLAIPRIAGKLDRAARERAEQLLEELDLGERADNYPAQLSGGERQRVAIGRALMNDPSLILVDEPTANLDSTRGRQVVEMLKAEVARRGKTAIMVTHDPRMAAFTDRVLRIDDGVVREARGDARWEEHERDLELVMGESAG